MDLKAAAIDGIDRRTYGRTPDRYTDPAPHAGSVSKNRVRCPVDCRDEQG